MGIQQIIEEWFNDLGIDISLRDSQRLTGAITKALPPAPLTLHCPACHTLHVDEGEWATRPHKTHQCQNCQHEWRPCDYPTVGVAPSALPAEAAFDVIVIAGQSYSERLADHAYVRGESVDTPELCGLLLAWHEARLDKSKGTDVSAHANAIFAHIKSLIDAAVAQAAPAVRDALGPFAKIAELYDSAEDDTHEIWLDGVSEKELRITLGQCRAARDALRTTSTPADDSQPAVGGAA
jgi:hypothetical protein